MNIRTLIPILSCLLLPGCTKSDIIPEGKLRQEITLTADVASIATRSELITEASIGSHRLHLDGYHTSTDTEYLSSNALKEGDGWIFFKGNFRDYKYYWPDFDLDFFAYAPYDLSSTRVQVLSPYVASTPQFTYSGQDPITEVTQRNLREFVCFYKSGCSYKSDNPLHIAFHHPFSQVSFKLDQSIRGTIKSVRITGIKNSGTATVTDAEPYALWNAGGEDTCILVDFSQMEAYSAHGGIRYPEDINNDSHLAGPFITVPQDLGDQVHLEVIYTALGSDHATTSMTTINKLKLNDSPVNQWNAGNRYVYALTLNGAANEIFVAVTISDWTQEGNTDIDIK